MKLKCQSAPYITVPFQLCSVKALGLVKHPFRKSNSAFMFHEVEVMFASVYYNRLHWIGRLDIIFSIQDYYPKVQVF